MREDQSPLVGGTIIHSSLWLFVSADASGSVADTVAGPLVESLGGCDVAVGKLGPKSSLPLLLVASLSAGCEGRSSKLAGGRLGPILRRLFADDNGDADRELGNPGGDICASSFP